MIDSICSKINQINASIQGHTQEADETAATWIYYATSTQQH